MCIYAVVMETVFFFKCISLFYCSDVLVGTSTCTLAVTRNKIASSSSAAVCHIGLRLLLALSWEPESVSLTEVSAVSR